MSSYLGFNYTPTSTGGNGAYGAVPGQIGMPPSIWQEGQNAVPQLGGLTTQTATNIGSELSGQLSPGTNQNLYDSAAARGVSLGQPNSAISNEIGLNLLGTTSETLQNTGINNYMNFLGGVGSQQLSPDLTSSIGQSNAILGAAPDPSAAVGAEQSWLQQYYQMMNPPSGGTGNFSAAPAGGNYSAFPMFSSPGGGAGSYGAGDPTYGPLGNTDQFSVYSTSGPGPNNSLY